jgi:predicted RNA-binding Zn-ribbon protein involved in translation (DUF1610 family)
MDLAAYIAIHQGVKNAGELLKFAFDAKIDHEAKQKIYEAREKLLEIQANIFELRDQLTNLQDERDSYKRQLQELEESLSRIDKYELTSTPGGATVYKYKDEPEHFACPSCINSNKIEILQNSKNLSGHYHCPGCKANYRIVNPTAINMTPAVRKF